MTSEALSHGLAGAAGGVAAMALLFPLTNVQMRLAVQVKKLQQEIKLHTKTVPLPPKPAVQPASHSVSNTTQAPAASSTPTTSTSLSTTVPTPLHPAAPVESGPPSTIKPYKGAWDCALRTVKEEGWLEFYRGLNSNLLGVGASSAIYFFWYSWFKNRWMSYAQTKNFGPLENLGVATIAGVVNCLMTTPIWVVSTRMTLQNSNKSAHPAGADSRQREHYTGTFDCFCKIYKEEGIEGLYKGLWPSLILVSNPAIQFMGYEQLTQWLVRRRTRQALRELPAGAKHPSVRLTSFEYFVLGAFAKTVATVVTYPYQVVKSRLQTDKSPYHGTMHCASTMWKEEGIASFFQGLNAKLWQTVLNAAFMFVFYERILRLIQNLTAVLEKRRLAKLS